MKEILNILKASGCDIENEVEKLIADLKAKKENYYGESVKEFQYYIKERNVGSYPFKRYEWMNPRSLLNAADTKTRRVASQGVASFSDALLPKGYESVKVTLPMIKQKVEALGNEVHIAVVKEMENIYTKVLQNSIKDISAGFMNMFYRAVDSYLNYGVCMSYLTIEVRLNKQRKVEEYVKFNGVRFEDIFIGYPNKNDRQVLAYRREYEEGIGTQRVEEYNLYIPLEDLLDEEKKEKVLTGLDLLKKKVEININTYLKVTYRNTAQQNMFRRKAESVENRIVALDLHDDLEIFVGKYPTESKTYSEGAGLQALGGIRLANYYYNAGNLATNLILNPGLIMKATSELSGESKNVTKNTRLKERKLFRFSPGEIVRFKDEDQTSISQSMQIMTSAPTTIDIFGRGYVAAIEQVEAAYNAEMYSAQPSPGETATATTRRVENSIRLFNGLAIGFYDPHLIRALELRKKLLVASFKEEIQKKEEYKQLIQDIEQTVGITIEEDAAVVIYNFEAEQQEVLARQKLAGDINLVGQLAQITQQPPSEIVVQDLQKSYNNL
jgi:hypothetical protein